MINNKHLIAVIAVFASFALFACGDDPVSVVDDVEKSTTFIADMSQLEGSAPAEHVVYVTGGHIGWEEPGTNSEKQEMSRVNDNELKYSITYTDLEDGDYEFKFFSTAVGEGWAGGEWDGDPNRSITVAGDETTFEAVFGVQPE